MKVTADLHVHSRFSLATSKSISPASLDYWARVKGIGLAGTGDCTHPLWLDELRGQLDEAEEGLFVLKKEIRAAFDAKAAVAGIPVPGGVLPRFVLTGEISTVYRKDGKTRKVHHLVILPGFPAAAAFQAKLERTGNIRGDGRPILGIDSRELLSLLLEADERSLLVPAHIWTPWFSVLGAKSGFDSIDECYGDLAPFIPAIETGLSSNPPMNWAVPSLDRFSIISNSDAHSPEKLGREATVFEMEPSFASLTGALRPNSPNGNAADILYTLEFFPQEGKYHYDGHRKCSASFCPEEAGDGLCPVCGRPLTMGVLRRVTELAGRPVDERAACPRNSGGADGDGTNRRPYVSLVPLRELIAELLGTGAASKKAGAAYAHLVGQAGNELGLLVDTPLSAIEKMDAPGIPGERLAEAVSRMRAGRVVIRPGYDGVYGTVRVFPDREVP
ncbi:MAG: endonuclease Q family protein [Spirochaetaceae bacterium]|jgi:uncharacterized protein (TIGR00375 family)|nr:endonuclease Q family protein [Spirochaetaceae bacterium]